jgi:hypothetical protein
MSMREEEFIQDPTRARRVCKMVVVVVKEEEEEEDCWALASCGARRQRQMWDQSSVVLVDTAQEEAEVGRGGGEGEVCTAPVALYIQQLVAIANRAKHA